MTVQSQFPAGFFMLAEAGAEDNATVATVPGPASAPAPPAAGTQGAVPGGGREDLTVFFSIGIVIDVLLVTVFLVWAVRQWRKAGK